MKPRSDPEVSAWMDKAERDLRMAKLAMSDTVPMPDQACFHAHQAAEKGLKALLVASDLDVPRSHNLVYLLGQLEPLYPALRDHQEQASLLTAYGVSPRYPSWLAEETVEEANEAIDAAESLLAQLEEFLGK
jgi:HEPN domain-containing protein